MSNLQFLHVLVARCRVTMTNTAVDVGTGSRNQAVVEISTIDSTTNAAVDVIDVHVVQISESGGCFVANSAVLSLVSIVSASNMNIRNVSLQSTIFNGTVAFAREAAPAIAATNVVDVHYQHFSSERIEQQHAHT